MTLASAACFALLLAPLASLLWLVAANVRLSPAVIEPCKTALAGSIEIVCVAAALAVPVGVMGGVYAAELAAPRTARILRLGNEILAGVPPIVIGLFIYATVVLPMGGFSLFAGATALALVIVPIVARATEDLIALVPADLRDASLGLGVPRYRVVFLVLLRSAMPGLASAVLLGIARALGDAAALLFTAASSRWLSGSLPLPTSSLPVEIFVAAQSHGDEARATACTMTLALLLLVGALSWAGRVVGRRAG